MFFIYLFISFGLIYLLLFGLVPKGNLIHEGLRLPIYQYHAQTTPRDNMMVKKHRFGNHRRQYFLHCQPKEGAKKKQVVIYYHGGGWSLGSPEMFRVNAQFFVDQGYEVFMPSYRRIPFYRYPAIREDLSNTLQAIVKMIGSDGAKNRQIILGGMSAGGNLVALMLYNKKELNRLGLAPDLFSGILLCGAPLDLSKMQSSPVLWAYAGTKESEMFRQASPIEYLSGEEQTPILCIHGKKDGLVDYQAAANFITKIKEQNPSILNTIILPEGTHLDTGSWNFHDNELRKQLIVWLSTL